MTRFALLLVLLPSLAVAADDPLVRAAAAGDGAAIRALLKQGHDVNATGPDGATALHWAVRADDLATVDALIRAGARVGVANALGVQPVYVAAQNGNAAMLKRLLDAKADVNATDAAGDTLLMAAVRAESPDAVRLLLERGAKVNVADPDVAQTALSWAARLNHTEIIRALLSAGATVDAATRVGPKAAARPPGAGGGSHGVGIVRSGVPAQGEQLPAPGGMTPLLFAARDGLLDAAKILVEAGADVNKPDPNGITPLLMAITNGQLPVAQFLVDRGVDLKATDWYGRTPLWAAVEVRNLDLRSAATENGVDREAALRLITALLDKGVDVNARVKEFPPARRYMLPLGSLEWVDITGQTAFTRAAQSADLEAMRLLLAKGADPKIATFNGTNALMMAAGVNWVIGQTYGNRWREAVQLCLDLGFDVNAVNQMGLAAVHGAANRGSDDVIELLAKQGARLDVPDKEGRTPRTWAEGVFLATNSPIAKPSTMALLDTLTKK
ncbi:MAG TPA: ankyrin repeat domain-containing protein [Vicinamibacterales bacterium]|nr:ankyrin repeat domain-containing protein [Vicinamibacterales bacterium]